MNILFVADTMMNLLSNRTIVIILKLLFIYFTFNITFISGEELSVESSPICSKCDCNNTDKTVICKGFFLNNINSTEFWVKQDGNESNSYPFLKMTFRCNLLRIYPFPKSPVKILDLSKNRIEIIDRGCFKHLQNMSELDLSDNDLISELFDPNIFEVSLKYQELKFK